MHADTGTFERVRYRAVGRQKAAVLSLQGHLLSPALMNTMGHQKKHEFEFFGPYGPAAIMLLLPATCYGLVYACTRSSCLSLLPELKLPSPQISVDSLFSVEATLVFLAWMGVITLLHLLLPGQRAQGVVLPNGKRLTYKLNGEGDARAYYI